MNITINKHTNLTDIDRLGELRAQIADLTAAADELASGIKARGAGSHEGDLFTATVSVVEERSVADPKAIAGKLLDLMGQKAFDRFCAAHLKRVAGYTTLKLTARN